MKIKTANELKEMVEKHNEQVNAEMAQKAEELTNSIVEGILVPAAKNGETCTTLNCGEYKYGIVKKLRELGYTVDFIKFNEIYVRWC